VRNLSADTRGSENGWIRVELTEIDQLRDVRCKLALSLRAQLVLCGLQWSVASEHGKTKGVSIDLNREGVSRANYLFASLPQKCSLVNSYS